MSISINTFLSRYYLPHFFFFFFNDPATTEIYTLSLHDALPIFAPDRPTAEMDEVPLVRHAVLGEDRKSTRLNSSHRTISYAVICLTKKKKRRKKTTDRKKKKKKKNNQKK